MVGLEMERDRGLEVCEREGRPRRFDVTETQAYRDLYANNLRMYSFLMTKERNREKEEKLRYRKEEYFQNHIRTENNQRNNRLLKSFKQMSRMRTCLSNLDLSRSSDSDSENSTQPDCDQKSGARKHPRLTLPLSQKDSKTYFERPRSFTALDSGSRKLPSPEYLKGRRSSAAATMTPKYLSVPSGFERTPSPLSSPVSSSPSSPSPVLLTSPTRQMYVPSYRRHYSDLGVRRAMNFEVNSDSDATNSDSEISTSDVNGNDGEGNETSERQGSPSLQRARMARIRQEYRKSRLASLEGEISKADSVLKDIKRKQSKLSKKLSENKIMENGKVEITDTKY